MPFGAVLEATDAGALDQKVKHNTHATVRHVPGEVGNMQVFLVQTHRNKRGEGYSFYYFFKLINFLLWGRSTDGQNREVGRNFFSLVFNFYVWFFTHKQKQKG